MSGGRYYELHRRRKLIQTFSQLSASHQPYLLYSGEGWYDWEMLDHNRLLDDPPGFRPGRASGRPHVPQRYHSQDHRRV